MISHVEVAPQPEEWEPAEVESGVRPCQRCAPASLPLGERPAPLSFEEVAQRYGGEIERRLFESNTARGLVGEMIGYHLHTGGKRLRALVPVWVCVNLGGRAEAALDLGA